MSKDTEPNFDKDDTPSPENGANSAEKLKIRPGNTGSGSRLSEEARNILAPGEAPVEPLDLDNIDVFNIPFHVIGREDRRTRITKTEGPPWRMICDLVIHTPSGGAPREGTGWLIGPRTVITAGHCVAGSKLGGLARKIEILPGRDEQKTPFHIESSKFSVRDEWLNDGNGLFDYAAIHLPSPVPETVGFFAIGTFPDEMITNMEVHVSGYPRGGKFPKNGTQQWHHRDEVVSASDRQLFHTVDAAKGQSGSPIFSYPDGIESEPVVVGVHTRGKGPGHIRSNGGVRINTEVFEQFEEWIEISESP